METIREQITTMIKLNTLIEVEIEIIKLRTEHIYNLEIDKVLTKLQAKVHQMKPYEKTEWDRLDLNPVNELVT